MFLNTDLLIMKLNANVISKLRAKLQGRFMLALNMKSIIRNIAF